MILQPVERGNRAPDLESLGRGGERLIEIGAVGMGNGADGLFGRRIEHRNGLARMGGAPFAIDE
jgi:hypothetical protein